MTCAMLASIFFVEQVSTHITLLLVTVACLLITSTVTVIAIVLNHTGLGYEYTTNIFLLGLKSTVFYTIHLD